MVVACVLLVVVVVLGVILWRMEWDHVPDETDRL